MGTIRLPVTITNSGKRMKDLQACYCIRSVVPTLSFKFGDVKGIVREHDGDLLTGTFYSDRDDGTYIATLQTKKRRLDHSGDDSLHIHYQGKWHNNHGTSGDFSIEWLHPDMFGQSVHDNIVIAPSLDTAIVPYGTQKEPVFLASDQGLFNDQGRSIMTFFLESLSRNGISRPDPIGSATWCSWKKHPEGCGDRVRVPALEPMTDRILAEVLRVKYSNVRHVMTPDRGYSTKDANVYSQGGSKGKHQDAQPYGSLVFVFCAGLACRSSVWLKNGSRLDLELRSGDCMIFEGKTWHQVHECIPNTSPFKKGEWLADRRLSILVRQKPPRD